MKNVNSWWGLPINLIFLIDSQQKYQNIYTKNTIYLNLKGASLKWRLT